MIVTMHCRLLSSRLIQHFQYLYAPADPKYTAVQRDLVIPGVAPFHICVKAVVCRAPFVFLTDALLGRFFPFTVDVYDPFCTVFDIRVDKCLVHARQDDQAEIDPECLDCEFCIVRAFICRAENGDQLTGEELCKKKSHSAHNRFRDQKPGKQLPDTGFLSGSDIKSHDRNAPGGHPHHDGNDDLEEFHNNANHSHGDLCILRLTEYRINSSVFSEHVVDGCHGGNKRNLRQKAGHAKQQRPCADCPVHMKMLPGRCDDLHVQDVPHRQSRCEDLPGNSSYGSSHHSPFKDKNEDRIKDDIHNSPCERRRHRELWISVRPDDGIHGLTEHVKRNAQGDVEKIFLRVMKGLLIDRAAEHGDDLRLKDQIDRGQNKTADNTHNDGVAHALFCCFFFLFAKADADKRAASVADHNGDRQRYDGERKYDHVGGISVRAEIAGVGNKDLVNDIIERADQKRDDARDRVLPHQVPDALSP